MIKINWEMKKLIETSALALATVNNNIPHCIAVGFAKVVSENQILITNNFMNETIDNINKNSVVAIAVWSRNWENNCKGYEFCGIAKYVTSGKWYDEIKNIPENKGMPCKGAILIKVNKAKKLA